MPLCFTYNSCFKFPRLAQLSFCFKYGNIEERGYFWTITQNTVLENLVKVDLSADRLSDKFDILKFYWAFGLVTHQF